MIALFLLSLLLAQSPLGRPESNMVAVPNDTVTGTLTYHLAKPTNDNPTKAILTATADVATNGGNATGICVANCGTSGDAYIVVVGDVKCAFDGSTTANNFVQVSDTQAGKCKDVGATRPLRGKIIGRVKSTNVGAGTYEITMFGIGVRGHPEMPASSSGLYLKDDGSYANPGGGTTPTGTGFRHVTGGVEDSASSLPTWTDVQSKPATFPPTVPIAQADVSSLVSDLAGKQASLGFTPENSANKNAANGYAGLSAGSKIAASQMTGVLASGDLTNDSALEKTANKGAANGYAGLDAGIKIPIAQIPTGSTASTVAIGNDARLSDARTPLAHSHPESDVTNLVTDLAGKAATVHTHVGADILSGTVPLATALAANGTNCPGGQVSAGADASGNAEGCVAASGVQFRDFHLGSSVTGFCIWTNKNASYVECANQASRNNIDLSGFTDARLLVNFNVATITADAQIHCSDDNTFGTETLLLQFDGPHAVNTLAVGAWVAIPANCKTAGGVYIRLGLIDGSGAAEDPALRKVTLQVR